MRPTVLGVALLLAFICLVCSEDTESEINEKRWSSRRGCKSHSDCSFDKYCRKSYGWSSRKSCCSLPRCRWSRRCPTGLVCSRQRCLRKDIKYCRSHSQCDRATECCSGYGKGYGYGYRLLYCKKLPGLGERCCFQSFNPCGRCSAGLQCQSTGSRFYGKCGVTPTTIPPTTEEPGSGEMDESLIISA